MTYIFGSSNSASFTDIFCERLLSFSSYYTNTQSSTVTVSGKNITETVDYSHYAYITGTLSPGNAILTINGKAVSLSSAGAFNVSVANGTYHVVASLSGYVTY
jgi:hypothetical protein